MSTAQNNTLEEEENDQLMSIPGTASLATLVDTFIMVVLRDGRKLVGILRSYDQFANLVLHDTMERFYFEERFAEVSRGFFLIRGESVVMICELDDANLYQAPLKIVHPGEIMQDVEREERIKKEQEYLKSIYLSKLGFAREVMEFSDLY